jgi:hypothetical protein
VEFFKGGIYMTNKNKFSMKQFTFKNLFSENTKTEIIGLLAILVCLWLVFYFIPEIFVTLFHTILGKCILFLFAIVISFYNVKYGFILLVLFIILYRFSLLSIGKEGFEWSEQSTKDFILIQSINNPNLVFDTNMIQKSQASQEEVDFFNKNGMWPWSDSTKDLYKKAIRSNPYVKIDPGSGLEETQKIYNEASILMLLSYQTKEGQFLINGVQIPSYSDNVKEKLPSGFGDFPYSSGLKQNLRDDVIRCNMETGNLERISYTGRDGIYGIQNYSVEPVDYTKLENIIPGFLFTKCPCNPCVAMKMEPEYTCPFKLNVKDRPSFISSVWQKLWNIKSDCTNNT